MHRITHVHGQCSRVHIHLRIRFSERLGAGSSDSCQDCETGKYTMGDGASTCVGCDAGKYQPVKDQKAVVHQHTHTHAGTYDNVDDKSRTLRFRHENIVAGKLACLHVFVSMIPSSTAGCLCQVRIVRPRQVQPKRRHVSVFGLPAGNICCDSGALSLFLLTQFLRTSFPAFGAFTLRIDISRA